MSVIRILKKFVVLVKFIGFYFYDLIISGFSIAWDVVTVKSYSRPGIIEVPLDAKSDLEITIISNLITFSPGSMVIGLSDDRRVMRVHLMFLENPEAEIKQIKEKLESRVLEVLR